MNELSEEMMRAREAGTKRKTLQAKLSAKQDMLPKLEKAAATSQANKETFAQQFIDRRNRVVNAVRAHAREAAKLVIKHEDEEEEEKDNDDERETRRQHKFQGERGRGERGGGGREGRER